MKVERIKRDLEMKEFLEETEVPEHTRNVKIVNRRGKHNSQSLKRQSQVEEVKDYFERSKQLLDSYYNEAFIIDQ